MATLPEQGGRSFRLGEALYEQKFALDIQVASSAAQLYQKALQDKAQAQRQMISNTAQLWPKYLPTTPVPEDSMHAVRLMVDHLSQSHVAPEQFVAEVRRQIPALAQFVEQQDLLTLDPDKPLVVRETPATCGGSPVPRSRLPDRLNRRPILTIT
ncbi:hypothetical protein GCM10023333_20760 [Ferrimonas pelagia]|uniref:Uncharacterized protein n=1 Tax=Ferrimonas pelagia TaxID=1177826 RepID=A0ABP9EUB2_9GAMM